MDIRIPVLRDYMDLPGLQESITQETHTISGASPYVVDLDQLPKIRTGASNVLENIWLSIADAETLVTVEIETSPDVWEAATLTESEFPSALQVHFQLSDPPTYPYSPRMVFHSSHKNQQVRITYTGLGSVPLARYFRQLYYLFSELQRSTMIIVVDMETYNSGRFDGGGEALTQVWAVPSDIIVTGTNHSYAPFPGLLIDFGDGGNAEVSGFSTAYYWKRLLLSVDYDGSWSVVVKESEEAEFRAELITPDVEPGLTTIAAVDVQNDGTVGTVGAIEVITADHIERMYLPYHENPDPHVMRYYGNVELGDIDVEFVPFRAGKLNSFGVFLKNSGSAGQTRVNVYRCSSSNPSGNSVFVDLVSQAVIPANGQADMVFCPFENFDVDFVLFTSAHWFRFVVEEVATGAQHLQACLYSRLDRF